MGPECPATWDSKVDKFDKRRALVAGKKRCAVGAEEVEHVSLYEFYDKFYVSRGHLCRSFRPVCLTVTPSFGAGCADTAHAQHEAYARAQVVAYWRMIPTEERRDILFDFLGVREAARGTVDTRTWGGTQFVWHVDRALGVQDLVMKFDGGRDRRGRETGWAMGLLEMLVDPYLLAFVPGWVVEQYERGNPFFRGSLRKVLRKVSDSAANAVVLRRTKCLMEARRERAVARAEADKAAGVDREGEESGSDPGASSDGEDPELDAPIDPRDVDAEAAPAVAMLREALPSAGEGGLEDGSARDDWARAGLAELLSAAGAATAAPDVFAAGSGAGRAGVRSEKRKKTGGVGFEGFGGVLLLICFGVVLSLGSEQNRKKTRVLIFGSHLMCKTRRRKTDNKSGVRFREPQLSRSGEQSNMFFIM